MPLEHFKSPRKVRGMTPNSKGYTEAAEHPGVWPAGRGVIVPRADQRAESGVSMVDPESMVHTELEMREQVNGRPRKTQIPVSINRKRANRDNSQAAFSRAEAECNALLEAGELDEDDYVSERTKRAFLYLEQATAASPPAPAAAPPEKKTTVLRTKTAAPNRPVAATPLTTNKQASSRVPAPKAVDIQGAINAAFEKLGIPDFGPKPRRPGFRVTFDFGDLGSQGAVYHWVLREADMSMLYLVFDRRFDLADPFTPPVWGSERLMRVHSEGGEIDCDVYNAGFRLSFGVFDIQCLLVNEDRTQGEFVDEEAADFGPDDFQAAESEDDDGENRGY